jgi:hypothetical protein
MLLTLLLNCFTIIAVSGQFDTISGLKKPCSVSTESDLYQAIVAANPYESLSPTVITLCGDITLSLANVVPFDLRWNTTFILTNKNIDLRCTKSTRCIVDGQHFGTTMMFAGEQAKFKASGVDFINGGHTDGTIDDLFDFPLSGGGAMTFVNTSIISFKDCSFYNNSGGSGGVISIYNSTLNLNGGTVSAPMTFAYNDGVTGGAVCSVGGGSIINVRNKNTIFRQNTAIVGGAFFAGFGEKEVSVTGASFVDNFAYRVRNRRFRIMFQLFLSRKFERLFSAAYSLDRS